MNEAEKLGDEILYLEKGPIIKTIVYIDKRSLFVIEKKFLSSTVQKS